MDRVQAAAYLPDNASPNTSEDNGGKSPKGKKKKFVILPQDRESIRTWGALIKQQKDFSVHILLQEEMTEKDIHDLVIKTFLEEKSIYLREDSFDFVTMDKDGHEYNCACKFHCIFGKYVHQENHKPAEWNTKNIRRAAKGNRDVYIRTTNYTRDTPESAYSSLSAEYSTADSVASLSQSNSEDNQYFEEAGSPANSCSTQARKRLRTGETKPQSEDRTYSVLPDKQKERVRGVEMTQLFSKLDITYPRHVNQDMKKVEETNSAEGNCTSDIPGITYSSLQLSAESSSASSALSLPQPNSEDNQLPSVDGDATTGMWKGLEDYLEGNPGLFDALLNQEQEGTSNAMMNETLQERTDTKEMMEPEVTEVTDITPRKGDIAGGDEFVMTVNGILPKCEGFFVRFDESGGMDQVFPISPCSVKGKVPPGSKTGIVMASLYANLGGNLLSVGVKPYEYTNKKKENNEDDPAYVERLLEKQLINEKKAEKWLMFIASRIGRGDWKPKKGTSSKDKEQCENDRTEALSLLRIIVETAAKIDAMKFFTIVLSTPVAHSVFKCFKDEQVRLEEVARENGNEELACFLEEKHKMYQPDESDSDNEVDWKALSKVAAEYQRRNAGSIETGVVADATSSESSQGYDGDLEISSSDSSDLQSNIGDHLEEAVGEPDTTSNFNSEEIKLDSDEQTVEPELRQQEEEPKLDDLIGGLQTSFSTSGDSLQSQTSKGRQKDFQIADEEEEAKSDDLIGESEAFSKWMESVHRVAFNSLTFACLLPIGTQTRFSTSVGNNLQSQTLKDRKIDLKKADEEVEDPKSDALIGGKQTSFSTSEENNGQSQTLKDRQRDLQKVDEEEEEVEEEPKSDYLIREKASNTDEAPMTSQLPGQLPCDNNFIHRSHDAVHEEGIHQIKAGTSCDDSAAEQEEVKKMEQSLKELQKAMEQLNQERGTKKEQFIKELQKAMEQLNQGRGTKKEQVIKERGTEMKQFNQRLQRPIRLTFNEALLDDEYDGRKERLQRPIRLTFNEDRSGREGEIP